MSTYARRAANARQFKNIVNAAFFVAFLLGGLITAGLVVWSWTFFEALSHKLSATFVFVAVFMAVTVVLHVAGLLVKMTAEMALTIQEEANHHFTPEE